MKYFLITIVTIMTLVGCGGAEERKEVYLEKAKLSLEAGDLDKARIELKNVLQIDPKDARAYFQLGDIYDLKKEHQKAFVNYSKAVELAADNLEYQAKIAAYHLIFEGDIDKATKIKDLILAKDAANVNGLMLKSSILLKQNDTDGAKKIAQDIFSKQPGYAKNAIFLSLFYLNEKKFDDSIAVLKASINENPWKRSLVVALANTYYQDEKYDLAEIEYRRILEKKPEIFSNYLMLASFYNAVGQSDKAEAVLRNAIKEDADANRMMALVEFIQQTKGNQSAIVELKKLIVDNKNIGDFRIYLAKLYVEEKNLDEAEKILEKAALDFPDDAVGIKSRVSLAILYMQKNNIDAATSIINDAIEISPNDSEVNFVKAKLEWVNKNYEEAIISLRIVIKDKPDNVDAYFLLSAAHKAIGEKNQADEIIKKAYDNNRTNPEALLVIARYHAKNKNHVELEKVVDHFLSMDQSNNYEALSYKSALLNESKMFSEAKLYASKLLDLYPDMPNGYIQSLAYMLTENKRSDAIKLLEDGYKKVEENSRILELLVSLYVDDKNFAMAENKVQVAIREKGETAGLYMLLSKTQWSSAKKGAAETSLLKASAIKPDWNEPYINLADLYKTENSTQKAIKILQQGLIQIEGDYKLTLSLAKIYEEIGDFNAAINVYENAYEKYSDDVILMNNLAALLSEYRSDENSLKRAKELANKLKDANQSVILDTVGWVYYKTGDYSDAVLVLKRVVEKSPNVPIYNYHLGMALYKSGDESAAKSFLTSALATNTNFSGRSDAESHLNMLQ